MAGQPWCGTAPKILSLVGHFSSQPYMTLSGGFWRLVQGCAGSSASVLFCSPRQVVLPQSLAPAPPWPECQHSLALPCCNAHPSPPPHHSLQALPSPRESRDEDFPG